MQIREFVWPGERVEHIALHGVEPEEVEEVCFGQALTLRAKSRGRSPVYYVLGQTSAGRHLLCVVIQLPDGRAFPVTARPMTAKEKARYNVWKKP